MPVNRYYSSTAKTTTLSAGVTSSAVNISVGSTSGFPTSYPYTLVLDEDTLQEEIVEVSAAAGTTLTVTRGVDGSLAQAHSAGARVRHHVSARDFRESQEHIAASSGVHGLSGSVVGTSDVQTLTNKTLTSPVIDTPTITAPVFTDFTNAPHDHGDADDGGNIPQSSVTDLVADLALKESVANVAAHLADTTTHGTTGAIVGTSDTQTLTNKTINGALNTLVVPQSQVTDLVADLALKAPLASPTFTGTVTLPGDPGSALVAAPKQYVDAARHAGPTSWVWGDANYSWGVTGGGGWADPPGASYSVSVVAGHTYMISTQGMVYNGTGSGAPFRWALWANGGYIRQSGCTLVSGETDHFSMVGFYTAASTGSITVKTTAAANSTSVVLVGFAWSSPDTIVVRVS